MYRFLWGGWVARPIAFYFCAVALVPCLILFGVVCVVALSFSPCFVRSHCSNWSPLSLNRVQPNRALLSVLVPNMLSVSALLG